MAIQIDVLRPQDMEDHAAWPMISALAVKLEANIPIRGFHVRDLLALQRGQTIESAWSVTEDAPLKVGHVQLCWCEFEVVDQRMALRLTRLA
jgi:flagellar motor switch protein FliN/FliY